MNAKILKEITVLPIETKVKFGDEDETLFKGKITAISIRKHTISYEIWLPEEDFKCLKNTGRTGIGFAEA